MFRARLSEAMARAGTSQAALARRVGISRSTLAQLLSTEVNRLPRADTVAAVATELKVSLDWLLGFSQVDKLGADILHESLQVAPNAQHPVDAQLIAWFEEAAGAKIRYVPGTLPVFAKTGEVLQDRPMSRPGNQGPHVRELQPAVHVGDRRLCRERSAHDPRMGGDTEKGECDHPGETDLFPRVEGGLKPPPGGCLRDGIGIHCIDQQVCIDEYHLRS